MEQFCLNIGRTYDADIVRRAMDLYPFEEIYELEVDRWLSFRQNIALVDDEGNVGMFEEYLPNIYTGHYFFYCRGKQARDLAKKMLSIAFNEYGIEVVRGLTPVKHRAATMMSRILGFKSYGIIDTPIGPCTIFIMTKDEFNQKDGIN